jgi:predicted lactoylglutathione lyase
MITTATNRELFLNLPVRDLQKSKAFFAKLGFTFNAQFTDDSAACMVLSDKASVMLLVEPRFRDFAKRPIADAQKQTGGIYAFAAGSKDEVDSLYKTALENGGSPAGDAQDHGFMVLKSFYDLDGHHWEVIWMDQAQLQK